MRASSRGVRARVSLELSIYHCAYVRGTSWRKKNAHARSEVVGRALEVAGGHFKFVTSILYIFKKKLNSHKSCEW